VAGHPAPEIAARLAQLVQQATSAPDYVQGLAAVGLEAASSTPQELNRMAHADFDRWAPIVKASGFVADE
jgi:tripartite-type tricarboxylate transporter receptor subunit TctC